MITHPAMNLFLTELLSKFLSMCSLRSLWLNELPFLGLTILTPDRFIIQYPGLKTLW